MTFPFLVCAAVTIISALVSLGFSVAAILGASGHARTLALYTGSRSLALAVASGIPILTGSIPWLQAVALAMTIVQACDAAIGVRTGNRIKTFGPAGTALANLAALLWLPFS